MVVNAVLCDGAPVTAATPLSQSVAGSRRLVCVILAAALLVAGCSSRGPDSKKPGAKDGKQQEQQVEPSAPPPPKVTMVPAAGAADVAPASPVTVEIEEDELSSVKVSAGGDEVAGALEPGGKRWASKGKLAFGAAYTVQVTTPKDSTPRTVGEFRTAAVPSGGNSIRAASVLGDGKTYGVGMPIVLKLSASLSTKEQRAAYERAITVKATPATAGAWGWINGKELHFRPKQFWAAGSKVHVSIDAAGKSLGAGKWGRNDMTVDFKIGVRREMRADSKTHTMKVMENGKLVRSVPISMGKPKFPSSSGTMVVIEKAPKAMFDSSTYGLPVDSKDGYRTEVEFPIRFTWGGQFIHSAPWSTHQQGKVNVSHGCINVAPANAKWIFDRIAVGDPVTITNTETPIAWADGWMEWSLSFPGWLKHSASGEVSAG